MNPYIPASNRTCANVVTALHVSPTWRHIDAHAKRLATYCHLSRRNFLISIHEKSETESSSSHAFESLFDWNSIEIREIKFTIEYSPQTVSFDVSSFNCQSDKRNSYTNANLRFSSLFESLALWLYRTCCRLIPRIINAFSVSHIFPTELRTQSIPKTVLLEYQRFLRAMTP